MLRCGARRPDQDGVWYVGLESRRIDYERDKESGVDHVEDLLKIGYYGPTAKQVAQDSSRTESGISESPLVDESLHAGDVAWLLLPIKSLFTTWASWLAPSGFQEARQPSGDDASEIQQSVQKAARQT